MSINASNLRANIYRLLDEALASGEPIVIVRRGQRLRIVPDPLARDLATLPTHPGTIVGDAEDLVHLDWSDEWKPAP